jgi:hypothetical protein
LKDKKRWTVKNNYKIINKNNKYSSHKKESVATKIQRDTRMKSACLINLKKEYPEF